MGGPRLKGGRPANVGADSTGNFNVFGRLFVKFGPLESGRGREIPVQWGGRRIRASYICRKRLLARPLPRRFPHMGLHIRRARTPPRIQGPPRSPGRGCRLGVRDRGSYIHAVNVPGTLMNTIRNLLAGALALAVIGCSSNGGKDPSLKEGAREVGHAVGTAAREVGQGAKKSVRLWAKPRRKAAARSRMRSRATSSIDRVAVPRSQD